MTKVTLRAREFGGIQFEKYESSEDFLKFIGTVSADVHGLNT